MRLAGVAAAGHGEVGHRGQQQGRRGHRQALRLASDKELDGEVAAGRLTRHDDVIGAADLLEQGTVGGRDVLERGGVRVLGREPVVDRDGAHSRLAGQAGRQPHRSFCGAERETAAVNVEDRAARLNAGNVDEDHRDAAQVSGRHADVVRQRM